MEILSIIALIIVIVFLLADRYFIVEQHQKKEDKLLDELSRMTKAVMAKNAHEYVMTTSIDKVPKEETTETKDPDEIPEEALDDEQFFQAIRKTNKAK